MYINICTYSATTVAAIVTPRPCTQPKRVSGIRIYIYMYIYIYMCVYKYIYTWLARAGRAARHDRRGDGDATPLQTTKLGYGCVCMCMY